MTRPTAYEYLISIVTKVNTNVCIRWPFHTTKWGYGQLSLPHSSGEKQQKVSAHRLAYKIAYGEWPMPQGMHSCDNRACFNPRHISPGTARDNSDDMVAKGRQAKGEDNGLSKLTEASVVRIRKECVEEGIPETQLAARYGVTKAVIHRALVGSGWKHVPNPVKGLGRGKSRRPRRRASATHCKKGHPLIEGNIYTYVWNGDTRRQCKKCHNTYDRDRYLAAKKAKATKLEIPHV
jgi:hypothetical protein